jgi:hypothetical protein
MNGAALWLAGETVVAMFQSAVVMLTLKSDESVSGLVKLATDLKGPTGTSHNE